MLIVFTFATAVIVGAVIALTTNHWWLLPAAIVIHAVGTVAVMLVIGNRLEQQDKPDPVTEAHIEAGDRPASRDGLTDSGRAGDRETVI